MAAVDYTSPDDMFAVQLSEDVISSLRAMCMRAHPNETGGVLVGYYNQTHQLATVTEATTPPLDSSAGRSWFVRGIHGLTRRFRHLWMQHPRQYYLGEWHYHPAVDPSPSDVDKKQLLQIAQDEHYKCPEPIQLIMGCSAVGFPVYVEIVLSSGSCVELDAACHTSIDARSD